MTDGRLLPEGNVRTAPFAKPDPKNRIRFHKRGDIGKINFREPYIRSVSDKTQRKYFLFKKLDPCNDLHSQYKRFPVQPDLIYSSARASSDPLAIYDFRPQIPVNCASYPDFVHVDHLYHYPKR